MVDEIKVALALVTTTGISEATKLIVNEYVKPKLQKICKNTEFENKTVFLEDKLNEYMERGYNNYLYMNTIVFRNQQKTINDLYIPLTVMKQGNDEKAISICINEYKDKFIPYYKKILLVDRAGMGKSTIIKYLYLKAIDSKKGIPILIELRKLNEETSLIDFIMNEMNGIRPYFDREIILSLFEEGDFIFFFDGYDEITDDKKKGVTENMQDFISKNPNNFFVISSREENQLTCFGNFQKFDIKPLSQKEAYELIRKYDNDGELSKELINKLENKDNLKVIKEFLENPLMVSLLYKAFEYKKTIPYKKQIFYRQVYNALFEDHDMSKGGAFVHSKKSKLDIDDFHKVLRAIGFITLNKGIIYSKEEFIKIICKAKEKVSGIEFKESNFADDVIHSVPIFVKEGIQYRWSHKSFQEYFAACYICFDSKGKQKDFLHQMSSFNKIDKYYNVLDFCYDIDYKEFAKAIIYPLIKELEKFYAEKYCSDKYNEYDLKQINLRKAFYFKWKKIYVRKLSDDEVKKREELHLDVGKKFEYFYDGFEHSGKDFKKDISKASINDNSLCIMYAKEKSLTLLKLLYNKGSNLIAKIKFNKKSSMEQNIIPGRYILNDDINNELNKKDLFEMFNQLIAKNDENIEARLSLIFNYDNCINLKNEIEKEIENEKDDINFL